MSWDADSLCLLVDSLTGWAVAALYFDLLSGSSLRNVAASGYGIAMLGTLLAFRGRGKGIANLRRRHSSWCWPGGLP